MTAKKYFAILAITILHQRRMGKRIIAHRSEPGYGASPVERELFKPPRSCKPNQVSFAGDNPRYRLRESQ
ncbi:hypothetical protein V6C27_13505 [Peptococcaceae bacterium 1198_IL3148]